jgi:N-methylhydantoinase A/oxoprolinase/acetone carboxylase beta subunit
MGCSGEDHAPENAMYKGKVFIDAIAVGEHLKLIKLGPESVGADVGTCYRYPDITVGDIDLILGYINPDYFLGGTVKLNKEAALKALEERLAKAISGKIRRGELKRKEWKGFTRQ